MISPLILLLFISPLTATLSTSFPPSTLLRCISNDSINLHSEISSLSNQFDVWANGLNWFDIHLPPLIIPQFSTIYSNLFNCKVLINDTLNLINQQQVEINSIITQSINPLDFHLNYHSFDEINSFLANILPSINPAVSVLYKSDLNNRTSTVQGRGIPIIIITSNSKTISQKHQIYIVCNQHAREWISNAACLFLAHAIVQSYNNPSPSSIFPQGISSLWSSILDETEIHIIPVANPDGLEYTRNQDRLYRKNMNGVDLNRNWGIHWGFDDGSSNNPDSQTYRGQKPFSEPETKSMAEYITCKLNPTPSGYGIMGFDIHSYGQLIMRPWGWDIPSQDDDWLENDLGQPMVQSMSQANPTNPALYTSTNSVGLYPVSGAASDFFTIASGFGFGFELRDDGWYAFILPPDQIIPTGRELVMGIGKAIRWRLNGSGGKGVYYKVPLPNGSKEMSVSCSTRVATSTTTIKSSVKTTTTTKSTTTRKTTTKTTTKTTKTTSTRKRTTTTKTTTRKLFTTTKR